MEQQANGSMRLALSALALAIGLSLSATTFAQRAGEGEEQAAPSNDIDAQTGNILNQAIELLNAENYVGAQEKINTLRLDRLSPYERGTVEREAGDLERRELDPACIALGGGLGGHGTSLAGVRTASQSRVRRRSSRDLSSSRRRAVRADRAVADGR